MHTDQIFDLLWRGTCSDWEEISHLVPSFPNGHDDFIHRRWIINAIDSGSKECVKWMLQKGVDLDFVDEEGRSPVHACLERGSGILQTTSRLEILEWLTAAGADLNLRGFNGWTPLHKAAAWNDLETVTFLLEHGADKSIRTIIDDDADPAEEAERLGKHEAAELIRRHK
jgi:ankyrin repeat protein